jgi:thioredoxin reductase
MLAMYDVIIVGGGASGLACALTLASSRGRGWSWAEGRTYLVFDTGESDLHKAYLKNVPGVQPMTGTRLLEVIREQIKDWGGVEFSNEKVVEIKKDGEVYKVYTETGKEYSAKYVVLAGGFKEFSIKGLELEVVENPKSPKPGRVMIKHRDFEAMPNLFVVGTLAGLSSHFTSCAGSGVEVAIEILSRMAGKRIVIHDVPQD